VQATLFQVFALYLVFVGTVTTLFWLIKKVYKNKIIILLYTLVMVSPFLLYLPVELNTYLYGKDFKSVELNTGFNSSIVYYKVFSINDKEAKLFYVEGKNGSHDMGNFYRFAKENGKWKYYKWERTMWTNLGGSASEFTVPPYF
jgi:hypothetical protein